jgi:hypothetical protein
LLPSRATDTRHGKARRIPAIARSAKNDLASG